MHPHDDPNLTAYALGELPPDASEDAAAIEARLATDADARQYVEQVRAEAARLVDALAGETQLALSQEQRAMIEDQTTAPIRHVRFTWRARLAMAACLVAGLGLAYALLMPDLGAARRTVRQFQRVSSEVPGTTSTEATDGFEYTAWDYAAGREQLAKLQNRGSVPSVAPSVAPTPAPQSPVSTEAPINIGRDSLRIEARQTSDVDADQSGATTTSVQASSPLYRMGEMNAPASDVRNGNVAGVALRLDQNVVRPPNDSEPPALGLTFLPSPPPTDREAYDRIVDNPFRLVLDHPLSTFSVDVDTASYANMRRFITSGQLPPPDAVRIEELINYFDYNYSAPADSEAPFAAHVEVAAAPWAPEHRLVRIGIKGYEVDQGERGPANLVFLLDVSGSMNSPDKLPLVKAGMTRLVRELRQGDRVAIVVYAGASGLVLDSTIDKDAMIQAIQSLRPGGSTNGAAGIELAYQIAAKNKVDGVNRVILCTDGDFNVGVTDRGQLTRLIEDKANSGVYLSILGFGTGNLQDATMEELSNKGDGNYAYIDSIDEAQRVLVEQMGGTLVAIAKDVKLQVEFNPATVAAYRLIGYENRVLAKEDFNDDTKDAGDIGSGHTVTALYEVIPTRTPTPSGRGTPTVDALKYQQPARVTDDARESGELLTLKLRYKAPDAPREQGTSRLIEFPVTDSGKSYAQASDDFKFASAVAAFGMILRDSPHKGTATFGSVIERAQEAVGNDEYRAQFVDLVRRASQIAPR